MSDRMVIYKYSVPVNGQPLDIEIPVDAEIVHVASPYRQADVVSFWAKHRVPPTRTTPKETRTFKVVGTGMEFYDDSMYIGTAPQAGGTNLVWHLLEIPHE